MDIPKRLRPVLSMKSIAVVELQSRGSASLSPMHETIGIIKPCQSPATLRNGLACNDGVLHHKIGLFKVGATTDTNVVARRFDRKVTARCH